MHIQMQAYQSFDAQKGAIILVVVLAVVRPPPGQWLSCCYRPCWAVLRQGFFMDWQRGCPQTAPDSGELSAQPESILERR